MRRQIEEVMGWTRDYSDPYAEWLNQAGEYKKEADVDDMLDWFFNRDMSLKVCSRSSKYNEFFVELVGSSNMVTMFGPTLKGTLAQAIREVVL